MEFSFRTNTQDLQVIRDVVINNEYGLPPDMKGMRVLDIGAHIGAFAMACLLRGAAFVECWEPDERNWFLLMKNMRPWAPRASCRHAGVWGGRGAARRKLVRPSEGETACSHVLSEGPDDSGPLCFGLDDIIGERKFDLLKLDCEGAEYKALAEAESLDKIGSLLAEMHVLAPALCGWTVNDDMIQGKLQRLGFKVLTWPPPGHDPARVMMLSARREA